MNQSVYCVYDRVAKVHYTPFFQSNDDHAKRTFMAMAQDPATPMNGNPQDFDLFHIGHYSSDQGLLEGNIYELVLRGAGTPENAKPELKEVAN